MNRGIKLKLKGRFGKWTIIEEADPYINKNGGKQTVYKCRCDCGRIVNVSGAKLNEGRSTKCVNCKERRKKPSGEAAFGALFAHYKGNAKHNNRPWELSKEEFRHLTSSNCKYCGIKPKQRYHRKGCNGDYIYNGIDRKNNDVGYILSNCVSCCWQCNHTKKDFSQKDFLAHVERIHKHQISKRKMI